MPSLLERVGRSLTRKKPEIITNNRDSVVTALEGFESVSANDVKDYVPPSATSPSQEKFPGVLSSFLRAKSPTRNAAPQPTRVPLLSLHLPDLSVNGSGGAKEHTGIVFEHPPDPAYTDEVLAAKRLSAAETLFLVQKTSSALAQRGLEMPGVFKTFWHAQNSTAQRRLVIAFLQTLPTTEPAKDAAAETTTDTTPAVDTLTELLHNTSPYDVAEVFKWAVRHFNHDGTSFGTSADEYGWYKTFAESEKTAGYPPDAYAKILGPLLPPENLELLNTIFQLTSSVAAYSEINGISGSKLSRSIGWWLLSERLQPTNGLVGFVQEWDTAARILEHLFLAYLRDQQSLGLVPKRLTRLIKAYPYPKQANPATDSYYLPRPKFSTQPLTVLFVRVAVPSNAIDFYQGRPIQLLKDAVVTPPGDASVNADYRALWESLKRDATADTGPSEPSSPVDITQGAPVVSVAALLSEGSVHTLTSVTGESAVTSPVKSADPFDFSWMRSFSPVGKKNSSAAGAESTNTTAPVSPMDWDDFTGTGFSGALNDSTTLSFSEFAPSPSKQASATVGGGTKSSRTSRMPSRRRRSTEFGHRSRAAGAVNGHGPGTPKTEEAKALLNKDINAVLSESVEPPLEIDETLIDGWAEILTDKTVSSRSWPIFALYELRNPLTVPAAASGVNGAGAAEPNRVKWLAIETYVNAPRPREPSSPVKGGKVTRSSSVNSARRTRFGFFSSTTSLSGKEKDAVAKEEKKEKRKDHNRRASEVSTDSVGAKAKDPASRSQADLSAPPVITEEPEPSTPLKGVPEENAIPDTAVAEKEKETGALPKASAPGAGKLAPIDTLAPPNTDGSRFVEGGTPGTIPESVTTEAPRHEDKSELANYAVLGAEAAGIVVSIAAPALLKHNTEPNVPVSENQVRTVENTATSDEVSPQPTIPIVDESQQRQTPATADEAVNATASAQAPEEAHYQAEKDAALGTEGQVAATKARADAEELERRQALKQQEENEAQRLRDEAKAEAERIEAERVEKEQAALRAKEEEEERLRLEAEERERQAELERQAALEAEARRQAELAEQARLEAEDLERQRIAAEEAAARKLLEEQEAERLRLEAEEQERQRIALEEEARLRAEGLERQRLAAEEAERQRILEEEARIAAEKAEQERLAAEEARLAAEKAEQERLAAEELEKQRIAEEARLASEKAEQERLAAEELERQRIAEEEARLAAEKAEQERLAAEELERQRLAEEARLAAEKAEAERLVAEELEKQRIAEEARLAAEKAEQERLAAEEAERQRIAEEEARLAAEKAEQERLAAEELERQRIAEEVRLAAEKAEEERLAAEALERQKAAEEEARLAAEKAEQERLAAEEFERQRVAEEARLAAEKAEQERLAAEELERQRIAEEEARLAAEKAEQERLAAEELERQRIAEEEARLAAEKAEQERLAAEELERQRLAEEEARLAAEKAEQERLAAEELERQRAAEEARLAAEKAEQERLAAEEEVRLAAEKAEQERLAAEELERQRAAEEEARLAAEKAEQERLAAEELERQSVAEEEARLAAEKAEQERLAAEELERQRIAEEEARLAAEKAEQERLAAEEARLAAEKAEQERLAAEELERQKAAEEEARLAAEKAEQERLAAEELERQKAAEEEARLAEEKAKQERLAAEELERQKAAEEEARLATEKAEQERLAAEELERQRIAEEARLAAEKAEQERLAAEELERQKAAEEEARLATEKAEQERLAAEELEKQRAAEGESRLAAEKAEQEPEVPAHGVDQLITAHDPPNVEDKKMDEQVPAPEIFGANADQPTTTHEASTEG